MSSNLFSFCSHLTIDNLVIYMWVLSIFISVWTTSAISVNFFFNPRVSMTSMSRVIFDKVEFFLIILSSFLILVLVVLNLFVIRSHVPVLVNNYDQSLNSGESIGVVGRQWYWVYNIFYSDDEFGWDSFITKLVDCVDNGLSLKSGNTYNLNITSADVLHSFSIPAAQMKIDAVPGRINSVYLLANVPGRHVGYCSEFCGAGHSYMPIVVNVV
uniref:cytochrome-c oxidase n=1 Tax=Polylabris halichoeres TaxID=1004784 RepID=G3F9Z4_POLHA|nr:cytochrome c oxidase subunit II [Polylabris halichoeres]AEB55016.1 cytochrome c oxidase subunit II [Polylabris halichoeres]